MRLSIVLFGIVLFLLATATANALEAQMVNASVTDNWLQNATVFTWRSMMNPVESDVFYVAHNTSHYLLAFTLYDNDNATDEWLNVYMTNGVRTILIQMQEGNDTATIYDVVGSTLNRLGTIRVFTEKSRMGSIVSPYAKFRIAIPKTYLNNATNVKVFIERKSKLVKGMLVGCWNFAKKVRFKSVQHWHDWLDHGRVVSFTNNVADVMGVYPIGATLDNPDTWAEVSFVTSFGVNNLELQIPVLAGFTTIELVNATTSTPIATLPASEHFTVSVPANVTIIVNVSGIPVFENTYYVNGSLSVNVTPNIKEVDTGFTKTIVAVEKGYNFSASFNSTLNATEVSIYGGDNNTVKAFVESGTKMVVLGAEYLAYNPITNRAKFEVTGNKTVFVKYPKISCILMAECLKDCECLKDRIRLRVGNGTIIVQNLNHKAPFAVAENGRAMCRWKQYEDNDGGNITIINATGGVLDIYYDNPCNLSVSTTGNVVSVTVNTPYSFDAYVNVTVFGKKISKKVFISAPTTTVNITLNVTTTTKALQSSENSVTVYDIDSQRYIGTKELSLFVLTTTEILLILIAIAGLAVIVLVSLRKSKQVIREKIDENYKFFKRL